MSIDSFFNAIKKNVQGTIHLSDPPLYVGRMRVEILIVIENSVFENLVCMLTVVENCRKCETWEEKQGRYVGSSPLSINFPMLNKTSAISNCEVLSFILAFQRVCPILSARSLP